MHVDRSVFLDASNDSINFCGGSCKRSIVIGGGFTAGAHADGISVHFTVEEMLTEKMYFDYRQRPGAVIPNACIKYVNHPDIGKNQGQPSPYGIQHAVKLYDSVVIGGGYVMYLDGHSQIERNIVGESYWYGNADTGDVYPPAPAGYKNNKNTTDVGDDYVTIAQGDGEPAPGPEPGPEPNPDDVQAQIDEIWATLATMTESQAADHNRLMELIESLHKV